MELQEKLGYLHFQRVRKYERRLLDRNRFTLHHRLEWNVFIVAMPGASAERDAVNTRLRRD